MTLFQVTSDAELQVTPNLGNEQSDNAPKLNSENPQDRTNSPTDGNSEILRENLPAPANDTDPMSLDPGICPMSFCYFVNSTSIKRLFFSCALLAKLQLEPLW